VSSVEFEKPASYKGSEVGGERRAESREKKTKDNPPSPKLSLPPSPPVGGFSGQRKLRLSKKATEDEES